LGIEDDLGCKSRILWEWQTRRLEKGKEEGNRSR
jgi:hypothetical protein